jgi:hypothetical protein
MSTKSQLHACGESLMIGLRLMERAITRDPDSLATLRACLDIVERLERSASNLDLSHVETALAVVTQASNDFKAPGTAPAVLSAIRGAADRLRRLQAELGGGQSRTAFQPAFR